ncbi:MAG: sulfur oxidation c-type cytochrome SoxA [Aeromicrobium sp.]|nr:sulfur oxidation c-type cytochrome SoxA [Burkholderiales bacterium]
MHQIIRPALAKWLIAAASLGLFVAGTAGAQTAAPSSTSKAAAKPAATAKAAAPAKSTDPTVREIEKYREALADGNPADLWEARGEDLWKQKRGPKQASLEKCDLGLGEGVVKGTYAKLPRYFEDTDRVQDLESRLVTCMVMLQGFSYDQAKRAPFGSPENKSNMEALVAYVTANSRGQTMNVSSSHPKEKEAYDIGKKMFFHRGGPHDFSCATCHAQDNIRIRLQDLPNLTKQEPAQRAYTSWPAYRVSQGELRSFQWRLFDCFRQQRFPELEFTSEGSVALTTFLARNANGGVFSAPSIKR